METIKKLCQQITEIMFYAVNTGLIEANSAVKIEYTFESTKKVKVWFYGELLIL